LFENRVLWRIFELMSDEATGKFRKLHEEHNIYSSPNIIRVNKSWRKRWAGYVVRMGGMRNANTVLAGKPDRNSHSVDLSVDGRTILKWNLRKSGGILWTGFIWLRTRTNTESTVITFQVP
jgi:hypothetical protein